MRQYVRWLVIEPRFAWICVAGLGLGVACAFAYGPSEQSIRISGMFLQLGGIVTVVWGIVSTRQFFGLPRLRDGLRAWWARAPFKSRKVVIGVGSGQLGFFGEGHAYSTFPVDHSAAIDDQIKALERNIALVHERITTVHSDARTKHDELKTKVTEHTGRLKELDTKLMNDMRSFGTSGLHISGIGAAWLFLGTIMGSASQEIVKWLR